MWLYTLVKMKRTRHVKEVNFRWSSIIPQEIRLKKKKSPWTECPTLSLTPGLPSKITSPKGLNKTPNAPIEGKHRKSNTKPYLKLSDFGRSFCLCLTQMSKLLKAHFKQNFKTILWRPYSETAKTLDSQLTLPCNFFHAEPSHLMPAHRPQPRDALERWPRPNKTQPHMVLCLYKLLTTVCSLVPTLQRAGVES